MTSLNPITSKCLSKTPDLAANLAEPIAAINGLDKTFTSFKSFCTSVATLARKIYEIAITILMFPITAIIWGVKKFCKAIVDFSFFVGFNMSESQRAKRKEGLILGNRKTGSQTTISPHKGSPIETKEGPLISNISKLPIDALYIKSGAKEKTGNVILFVLGKEYQALHPKNFDHLLDDGADVVFFNPSAHTAKAMASDLKKLIGELKRKNPQQEILLHGYCIGAHVAVSVATDLAEQQDLSLPVLVDRGFGDGYKIAKKICSLANASFVKNYIDKYYNKSTIGKIQNHKKAMLFLSPKDGDDQAIHKRKKGRFVNYTKKLFESHQHEEDKYIELENSDHWSKWTYKTHNKVKQFFSDHGILSTNFKKFDDQDTGGFPKDSSVPWFRKHLLPLFIQ